MAEKDSTAIANYLQQIARALKRNDATEHTHRPALKTLVETLAPGITCTNEPKKLTDAGKPDMMVSQEQTLLGWIETKDVGTDLDRVEKSEQMKRYLSALPNLLLTNYLEFRWYQFGKEVNRAVLSVPDRNGNLRRVKNSTEEFLLIFDNFIKADVLTIFSPRDLAKRMASLARLVKTLIIQVFQTEPNKGDLHAQLKAFREVLLPDLDVEKFADMYAQTICYGLFAAKCNTEPTAIFARETAADHLPRTNPFLRQLFHHIVGPNLDEQVRWAVVQIVSLLNHTDIGAILRDFGKRTRQEDPVVHFYETFLAEYDPHLRKTRGVYYTPEPVVSYIVRSVDRLLKEKFGKKDGLADPSVFILDPACGTGTFLYHIIKLIYERIRTKGQYGTWSSYVRHNLLNRIFGFELLMAPYTVAHLKLGLLLQETGYDFSGDERLGIYLTNTLEETARKTDIIFAEFISREANAAVEIKKDKPIMVVLGNPPYSGISANMNNWIDGLLHGKLSDGTRTGSYYEVDGVELQERKVWLQDDYVKFIRWSQWRIEKTGYGIHAFISNNGYLDNPTFRGMRQQLMKAFDELYILDLHGSAKKKEIAPDGSKDENVFDIQQGVCIGIFLKTNLPSFKGKGKGDGEKPRTRIYHSDLFGLREAKYQTLASTDVCNTEWTQLKPVSPFYLFTPQDIRHKSEYEACWRINEIMPVNVTGIVTARDAFVIDFEKNALIERMRRFTDPALSDNEIKELLQLTENYAWRVAQARNEMRNEPITARRITPILYRPFDTRFIYYHPAVVWRTRFEVMRHMLAGRNLALVTCRQQSLPGEWRLVFVSEGIMESSFISNKTAEINSLLPLYLYPNQKETKRRFDFTDTSPWQVDKNGRVPNLNPDFVKMLEQKLGLKFVSEQPEPLGNKRSAVSVFGPEDIFVYIYAIFYCPTYRKRYAEFLKIDFPRVPLTSDRKLFWRLVALGRELISLHLLESPKVMKFVTRYPKKGSDIVEKVQYVYPLPSFTSNEEKKRGTSPLKGEGKTGSVYINSDQFFEGIRPEEWEFHIGGYPVLQKWLKDRKGRKLTLEDIHHYQKIVVAIRETIRVMAEIDKTIPKWPMGERI